MLCIVILSSGVNISLRGEYLPISSHLSIFSSVLYAIFESTNYITMVDFDLLLPCFLEFARRKRKIQSRILSL